VENMSFKGLASEIAKREGLTKEVGVGNIREIIGILCDIIWERTEADELKLSRMAKAFATNGKKRALIKQRGKLYG
jgi:hypothetical protein